MTIAETTASAADISLNKQSERLIPEIKGVEKIDTVIASRQLEISITKSDLDSYVNYEYQIEGHKQNDKYRNAEFKLTIKQNSKTILDTTFRKEQFTKYAEKAFMDIAIFHNYWFENLDKDRVELIGVIAKPETDWTIDFHHYFDLKNKKMVFKQAISDEE